MIIVHRLLSICTFIANVCHFKCLYLKIKHLFKFLSSVTLLSVFNIYSNVSSKKGLCLHEISRGLLKPVTLSVTLLITIHLWSGKSVAFALRSAKAAILWSSQRPVVLCLLCNDVALSLLYSLQSAAAAPSPVLGNMPPGDGMPVGPVPPGFFQVLGDLTRNVKA